jgi:hypothetical protein
MNSELPNSDRRERHLPQKTFLLQDISDAALATLGNMREGLQKVSLGL